MTVHLVQGVPVFVERDPDDGRLFPVCCMCSRALAVHSAEDLEACAYNAECEEAEQVWDDVHPARP